MKYGHRLFEGHFYVTLGMLYALAASSKYSVMQCMDLRFQVEPHLSLAQNRHVVSFAETQISENNLVLFFLMSNISCKALWFLQESLDQKGLKLSSCKIASRFLYHMEVIFNEFCFTTRKNKDDREAHTDSAYVCHLCLSCVKTSQTFSSVRWEVNPISA